MEQLEKQVYRTILENRMIHEGDKVVAGISGGADSVALLCVLADLRERIPFDITAVHVEHGVRGEESLADAQFAQKLCERLSIPCITVHVDMLKTAKEEKMTAEEAGRILRYRTFEQIREQYHAQKIAVAHHANDQAETVLMNLARGSAIRGIGGIRPVNGNIIRPLLDVTRKQIESYLLSRGQEWRTDRTNLETDYTRNRVRLQVMPLLEEAVNERACEHICRTAAFLRDVEDYMQRESDKKAQQILSQEQEEGLTRISIDLTALAACEAVLQPMILRSAIAKLTDGHSLKDIGNIHIKILTELIGKGCGASADLPAGICALRTDQRILLERKKKEDTSAKDEQEEEQAFADIELAKDGEYTAGNMVFSVAYRENPAGKPPQNQYTKWLAYDTMKGAICIRRRRSGDYLIVNEAGGRKKLKDYLIDRKVPRRERDQVLVLAQGSHVLWVVGMRISEEAKINDKTKAYMEIVCRRSESWQNTSE